MDINKLTRFLTDNIEDTERPEGPVVKIVLYHVIGRSTKGGGVRSFPVKYTEVTDPDTEETTYGCQLDDEEIADMARTLYEAAFDDCEGMGGAHAYKVSVFCKFDSMAVQRFTFRLTAEETDLDISGVPELGSGVANPLLHQLMRHNEAIMRTMVVGVNGTVSMMSRTIARQADEIERLMVDRRHTIELTEELHSRKHERRLELEESQLSGELKEEAARKFMLVLPLIVNKVVGKKVLPEDISANEELIHSMIMSMTSAQVEAVQGHLSIEQQQAFGSVLDTVVAKQEQRDSKKKKRLKSKNNGA